MILLHIGAGAFRPDTDSHQSSLWHALTPRTRVLCVMLMVFGVALTPNGRWWTWAIYGTGLLGLVLLSRVTVQRLLKRIVVEFLFLLLVLVGTLFHQTGEVVWQWGLLQITTDGLQVLGSVLLKAFLSLLALNLLVLTTSIPALLHALAALRMPPLLIAIFSSMYRYIGLLIDEFNAMRRAALSRNLTGGDRWQRLVIGNMIGALFIRTYDRGDRIHHAMLSRGYMGLPPLADIPTSRRRDYIALTLTTVILLIGQGIYLGR